MGGGSNIKINYQWVVYSFLGMSRIFYKIIKIFQNIVIIILLFYVILHKNSATNFKYRLFYDTHVQFTKCQTIMPSYSVTCGGVN